MRPFFPFEKRNTIIDTSVLKDIRFFLLFLCTMCGTCAYFAPFFYLPVFSAEKDGKSEGFGADLIIILNAASTVGRIGTGFVADKVGKINTVATVCIFATALSIYVLWLPFHTTGTMIAMAIIFGLFGGGIISLLPVIVADLFGVTRIANIIGLFYVANFCGTIVGAPSMGAILDNINGHGTNFTPSIVFAAVFMTASAFFQFALRLIVSRKPLARV